jgi:hypothetical protein
MQAKAKGKKKRIRKGPSDFPKVFSRVTKMQRFQRIFLLESWIGSNLLVSKRFLLLLLAGFSKQGKQGPRAFPMVISINRIQVLESKSDMLPLLVTVNAQC